VGDTVKLMGFDAGEITRIIPMPPDAADNVYVELVIKAPNYGYLWTDSMVKVESAGLLGNRYLEVTKGGTSGKTGKLYATYKEKNGRLSEAFSGTNDVYRAFQKGDKGYFLAAEEPPELSSQVAQMVQTAKDALPNFLALTNPLTRVLTNAAETTARADELLAGAQPLLTNLTAISAALREPKGSLGEWLIPSNLNQQLSQTLASANTTLLNANLAVTNTDQRLALLVSELEKSIENLADITGNLKAQVQANTNLVTSLNRAIIDADDFLQGLKRHWLLRSAFKGQTTNRPPPVRTPARPPRLE
jgi:ABC-type transporter Mla subunit MlaD